MPKVKDILETDKKAIYFHDVIIPAMNELRVPVDTLEMLVEKNLVYHQLKVLLKQDMMQWKVSLKWQLMLKDMALVR